MQFLGLANSDAGIRVLAFFVGLLFLGSLWFCVQWIGGRTPILALALLGSLPAFLFTLSSNRAYGLACCLLLLTFGTIWRFVELPSRRRLIVAGSMSLLFLNCVYYDVVFLCAMLVGAATVLVRRRQWKALLALAGTSLLTGASLLVYLPVIRKGSAYAMLSQQPFGWSRLWAKFGAAVSAWSSAQGGWKGPEIWVWATLLLAGTIVAMVMQFGRTGIRSSGASSTAKPCLQLRMDLALFSGLSMFCGLVGYAAFLLHLGYPTQSWYYMEFLALCAISFEAVLGLNWLGLRPWRLLRLGFLVVMIAWNWRAAWEEGHTRRSNVDILAEILGQKAQDGDLIVVQSAWEAITFDRYFHGATPWMSVPPINSHKVHRNDLVWEKVNQPDAMTCVIDQATKVLQTGHSVWVIGILPLLPSDKLQPPPAPPVPYSGWQFGDTRWYWCAQLGAQLVGHATQTRTLATTRGEPVNLFENLPLTEFSGYRPLHNSFGSVQPKAE